MIPIHLVRVKTNPAKSARNLGSNIRHKFTLHSHISAVCSSWLYHMWDLWRIRCYLDLNSATLLATALVSSRLDYCNSLLYGIMDTDLTKLQHIQNQLAHLVTESPPFICSVPLFCSLHSLPVRFRILFKINLFTYRTRAWKTACLSSLHAYRITPIPFTEIEQWYLSVGPQGQDQHRCKSILVLCPVSLEQPPAVCPFSYFSCYLQEISQDTPLWLGLCPVDTSMPDGPLMLQNCFIDFAVEHWFGCHATEPGFTGDIGSIEIWLIGKKNKADLAYYTCIQGGRT